MGIVVDFAERIHRRLEFFLSAARALYPNIFTQFNCQLALFLSSIPTTYLIENFVPSRYNSLVTMHEEAGEQLQRVDLSFQKRIGELEDMNLKWQARYEKQTAELERVRKWVADHAAEAQELGNLQQVAGKADQMQAEVEEGR